MYLYMKGIDNAIPTSPATYIRKSLDATRALVEMI